MVREFPEDGCDAEMDHANKPAAVKYRQHLLTTSVHQFDRESHVVGDGSCREIADGMTRKSQKGQSTFFVFLSHGSAAP